jgi:dTDP-4-amino-4,6-dideoxygalactose transaminase
MRSHTEAAVLDAHNKGEWIQGFWTGELERRWAEYMDVPASRVVACSSCQHALHLAYQVAGLAGKLAICPAMTYRGTAIPYRMLNVGVKYHDIRRSDFGLDPDGLERSIKDDRIEAVTAVHLHGMPCDIRQIANICKQNGATLIEDCCQSHGATHGGTKTGLFGDYAAWSLNACKTLPAGQGGILLCPSTKHANKARHLRGGGGYGHGEHGYSYHITEHAAAIATTLIPGIDSRNIASEQATVTLRNNLNPGIFELPADFATSKAPHEATAGAASRRSTWHKVRVWLNCPEGTGMRTKPVEWREQVMAELQRRRVPVCLWEYQTLPEQEQAALQVKHPNSWEKYAVANAAAKRTFILGTEKYPLHAQGDDTIGAIADAMNEVSDLF